MEALKVLFYDQCVRFLHTCSSSTLSTHLDACCDLYHVMHSSSSSSIPVSVQLTLSDVHATFLRFVILHPILALL